jgi:hypothetical protein
MIRNILASGVCFLLFTAVLFGGCFGQDEYDVTITLIYSSPHLINNTTVYLNEELLMNFENYSLEIYPPMLDDETVRLDKGEHLLEVIDTNFNLSKTYPFNADERLYIEIIISEDLIDISQSDEPTEYK